MPFTLTMPKLSPTMEEGVIAKWLKKEGEYVNAGETLLEITTDKATVEYAALDEGFLRKIVAREGDLRKINEPLAVFSEKKDDNIESFIPKPAPQKEEVAVMTKVDVEQPKATPKESASLAMPLHTPEPPLTEYRFPFSAPNEQLKASPYAKKLAKEKSLDISTLKGSGPGGRVTSKDLKWAQPSAGVSLGSQQPPKTLPGSYKEITMSPMRKIIARRLQESKSFIPHFYVQQKINATALINLRKQLKNFDVNVSFNDMIVRACALALRQHPKINRGFNSQNQTIIQFETIDISVAVSIEDGLITPIVRHADYKNLSQISLEIKELSKRAHETKLAEQEYKGGSFCISNMGMYGITEFTAVVNPPQAAILAVGGIEEAPVIMDGKVVPGHTLTLNLSVDHRVVDGADAAHFLKTLQLFLENPVSLTL